MCSRSRSVNNTGSLPAYYPISPLWNRHHEEFISVRAEPEVRDGFVVSPRMSTEFDCVVIDTGPLFTILTLNYVRRTKRQSLLQKIDEEIRRSFSMQDACLQLSQSIRSLLSTSHVIGEIQGLQTSRLGLKGEDVQGFWLASMELLALSKLDKRLLRLIEDGFQREDVRHNISQIGPTDAGLIELALREGCMLPTDDQRTLAPLAYQLGVDCRIFKPMLR